jgi:hypothetical protein
MNMVSPLNILFVLKKTKKKKKTTKKKKKEKKKENLSMKMSVVAVRCRQQLCLYFL